MSSDIIHHILKFNNSTNGRDKLCRLFQYGSKFGWWYCEVALKDEDLVNKLKTLETALSATRKVLRFGKSLDMLEGAYESMQLFDRMHRWTISLSRINQAIYLILDHMIWMGKIGLIKVDTKKYAKIASRFWLVTLMFNLTRNAYDICNILIRKLEMKTKTKRSECQSNGDINSVSKSEQNLLLECVTENKPVFVDTLKNVTDLTLPLASLHIWNTPAGFQGIMGIIASLVGIATAWNSKLKLIP